MTASRPTPRPTGAEADPAVDDLFWSRTVPFAFHGVRLRFDLATTLFASAGVDPGSALLLRHLQSVQLPASARVLDVGCGHGVLGLVLLALDRTRHVTMVDRDALACHYTSRNLAGNDLPEARAAIGGSLGYDDVPAGDPFDLIVSNLPGKAGEAVITDLASGVGPLSRPGTVLALVVVAPLADLVRGQLTGPVFELLVDRGNRTHQVLVARVGHPAPARTPRSGFGTGLYDRRTLDLRVGDLHWRARTVTGLDEFDSLSHATTLLRGALRGVPAGDCTIVNPGQGHRALIAARSGQRVRYLVARDLLALRASERLLADNALIAIGGPSPRTLDPILVHALSPAPADGTTALLLHAEDKVHTAWYVHEVRSWLARLGSRASSPVRVDHHLVLTGRAGLLGRLEADVLARGGGRVAHKQNHHGYRVIRYQVRA